MCESFARRKECQETQIPLLGFDAGLLLTNSDLKIISESANVEISNSLFFKVISGPTFLKVGIICHLTPTKGMQTDDEENHERFHFSFYWKISKC